MKLKHFNSKTLPRTGTRDTVSRINFGKSGAVNINGQAAKVLDIKAGDKISISQDEEDPINWYVYKDEKDGFPVRAKKDSPDLQFNHNTLRKEIVKRCDLSDTKSHSFRIAGQPTIVKNDTTKYWGLIIPPPSI